MIQLWISEIGKCFPIKYAGLCSTLGISLTSQTGVEGGERRRRRAELLSVRVSGQYNYIFRRPISRGVCGGSGCRGVWGGRGSFEGGARGHIKVNWVAGVVTTNKSRTQTTKQQQQQNTCPARNFGLVRKGEGPYSALHSVSWSTLTTLINLSHVQQ